MQKEMMMLFLLALIAIVFISESHNGLTGDVASSLGQIRAERIGLYLSFPQPDNPSQHMIAQRVRKYLLQGAHDDYFYGNNVQTGHLFFDNELFLVDNLMILACQKQSDLVDRTEPTVSIGTIPCDSFLQQRAIMTLDNVMELDRQLVEMTIFNSECPYDAQNAMILAQKAILNKDYISAVTNLRVAWSKATIC